MTLASKPNPARTLPANASFAVGVRTSLSRILDAGVRAAATVPARSLARVRDALRADDLETALRHADHAWRSAPEDAATIAPIYGRLLMLEARDHAAALGLLRHAAQDSPDPDVAALIVVALLSLGRPEDARQEFATAVADYCIVPDGLLAGAGGALLESAGLGIPGWVGRGPEFEVVGALAAGEPQMLHLGSGGTAVTQLLPKSAGAGPQRFSFKSSQGGLEARLEVSSRGRPLLGSGSRCRPDFSVDGRADSQGQGTRILGWARVGWSPAQPVRMRIEDETGGRIEARTGDSAGPGWRWPFKFDARAGKLSGDRLTLCAQLPDGRWQPLPDSPLLLEGAVLRGKLKPAAPLGDWSPTAAPAAKRRAATKRSQRTDIIMPVYGNRAETLACIDSVLATLDDNTRLVVVDDASEDPALAAALDALEADGRIQLLRNAENRGFVVSANRGLRLHCMHDAVLLNSDTRVFADWLPRLRAAAYSDPMVGTVTPLTNSGSIASYPHPTGAAIDPEAAAALHTLAATTLPATRVEIPEGVGFCLYLRRDCLRAVGELDAAVFGQGYGEESDFCQRARRLGWTHALAADVFVYHAEGSSFGARRTALLERSHRLINLRYPGYDAFIASFLEQDPLRVARRRLDEKRLLAVQGRFVLLVTLALEGGVARYVRERCRDLTAQGLIPVVLQPAAAGDASLCELWTGALDMPNLKFAVPAELADLTALLGALHLQAIEIQHFLHLDARVIEAVRALGVPYDVVIHDYSWFCPRVTLIDGTDRYCGEPAVDVCVVCVRRNGSKLDEKISVPALLARSAAWLAGARQVMAPSADAAARVQRHFPNLSVDVRPHDTPLRAIALPPRPAQRQTLRVALIGAIGSHKGYQILLACARDARQRNLSLEFVIIGLSENDAPLLATGKVFITGHYDEAEAPHLLQRERPDVAWLPSVCPETWSYTLDYVLAAGLPVVAFDLGAIAERLRAAGVGELLPLELDAPSINDRLLAVGQRTRERASQAGDDEHDDSDRFHDEAPRPADLTESPSHLTDAETFLTKPERILTESEFFETRTPHARDDVTMLENTTGELSMAKSSSGKTSSAQADPAPPAAAAAAREFKEEGLSASVQVLPLPPGLYLFSVKAGSPPTSGNEGGLSLPAMHVGLGPGVRSDQVEFIAGPSTHGAWLFSTADLLVTKVNSTGATLILNSVRAPGGEVLSIGVERLEGRADILASPTLMASTGPAFKGVKAAKATGNGATPDETDTLFKSAQGDLPLSVQISAHIRKRGDMTFTNVPWAGRIAPGLWIESFSLKPLEHFAASDIEYKGLTGSGFETPWLSDGKMCGTKGMATPLVGFAIKLKPGTAAAAYDCEYSGFFQSGTTVGPLRNGAPCRSSVANDSLEGIQLRLVKRAVTALPEAARKPGHAPIPAPAPAPAANPKRAAAASKPVGTAAAALRPDLKKSASMAHGATPQGTRATRRQPTRRS